MVNIDNLVNEWAYRCKKGYPDMDSPSDLRVLKTILKEEGIKLPEQQLSLFSDDEMEKLLVKGVGKPIEKITAKDLTRYAEEANLNDEEISEVEDLNIKGDLITEIFSLWFKSQFYIQLFLEPHFGT